MKSGKKYGKSEEGFAEDVHPCDIHFLSVERADGSYIRRKFKAPKLVVVSYRLKTN